MALEVLVLAAGLLVGAAPEVEAPAAGASATVSEREALERLEAEVFGARAAQGAQAAHTAEARARWGLPPSFLDAAPAAAGPAGAAGAAPALDGPRLPGFTVPVVLNGPVREYLDFFQGRGKSILAGWLTRLARHRAPLEALLAKEGAPPELVFVAMIESGFDPTVTSRAGAVGPWQIMPRTGTLLGLRRDGFVDERRSWERSTRVAARYLLDLQRQFGSWPLALAAYNCGPAIVEAAVSRTHEADFWSLAAAGALPEGTTRYVPKIMAAMILGADPGRYGFPAAPPPAEATAEVRVAGSTDLRALARSLDLDAEALVVLNPELRRGYTPPGTVDWSIQLPARILDRFNERIDTHAIEGRVFEEHVVRFGERLRDVAQAYAVPQSALRRLNDLPAGDVRAGQVLLVPADARPANTAGQAPPLLVRTDPGLTIEPAGRREVYLPVSDRMEVAEVAAFFGISPGDVGLWNGLDPEAPLRAGQVLRLFIAPNFDLSTALVVPPERVTTVAAGTEAAANALAHAGEERLPGTQRVAHVVARGETLWRIAKKYRVSLQALRAENGLGPRDRARPGSTLQVPVVAPKNTGGGKASRTKTYTVVPGDSLNRIAKRLHVTERALLRANKLDAAPTLRPGQVLKVP